VPSVGVEPTLGGF